MRKARFTESQIVGILKEGEAGVPIADLVRKRGISRTTNFNWRCSPVITGPKKAGRSTAPAAAAHRPEPRVGVRLRVRHLCESADAQMPDDSSTSGPRECLAIDVAGGIRSGRVIEVLAPARQRARRPAAPALRVL